jgi:hypothetical protein
MGFLFSRSLIMSVSNKSSIDNGPHLLLLGAESSPESLHGALDHQLRYRSGFQRMGSGDDMRAISGLQMVEYGLVQLKLVLFLCLLGSMKRKNCVSDGVDPARHAARHLAG